MRHILSQSQCAAIYTRRAFILVAAVFFVTVFWGFAYVAEAQVVTGGLRGHYSLGSGNNAVLKTAATESINFPMYGPGNFNSIFMDRVGRVSDVSVNWYGALYIAPGSSGSYKFSIDVDTELSMLFIDDSQLWYGWGDRQKLNVDLSVGWHNIWLYYRTANPQTAPSQAQLYWDPPGGADSWELIPSSVMSPQNWSGTDDIITIPGASESKQRLNYVTAGVSSKEISTPQIQFTLPSYTILDEDVWVIWMSNTTPNMRVRNIVSGESEIVTGTYVKTIPGVRLPFLYAKVPEALIPDSGQELRFSFEAIECCGFDDAGIALIVPYIDPSRPLGRISIRSSGFVYHSMSQAMVFPLRGSAANMDIRPIFVFSDGETKYSATEIPPQYRPNYLVMRSGTGAPPSEFAILQDMGGSKIVPQSNPLNLGDSATWYPVYGREGEGFDIISPNYTMNQWSGATSGGGQIPQIAIDTAHTWIAFQYYSTNFLEDGVDGNGESTYVLAGGIFSEEDVVTLPIVTISAFDPLASEEGMDTGTFRIFRTGSTASSLMVSYTRTGTAVATDYTLTLAGSLVIPTGQNTADIMLTPVDDMFIEETETVILTLAPNAAYTIGTPSAATVSILDNDVPFDFSLSVPANKSVIQGQSTTTIVTATRLSGISESVSFSVSGLPAGATASFSPTFCNPTCTSVLTITAEPSTLVGTYTITVTGIAGALVKTASFDLTVIIPPAPFFKEIPPT